MATDNYSPSSTRWSSTPTADVAQNRQAGLRKSSEDVSGDGFVAGAVVRRMARSATIGVPREDRPPFVLVAGAWLGGWAWRDVARRLRVAGHEVHEQRSPNRYDNAACSPIQHSRKGRGSGALVIFSSAVRSVITPDGHRGVERMRC